MKKILTEQQIDMMCKLYEEGISGPDIAALFGVVYQTAWRSMKQRGIDFRNAGYYTRKHDVDHRYFAVIDTAERAYWVGYLLADSGINKNSIQIGVHRQDRQQLEKFLSVLKTNYPIQDFTNNSGSPCSRICITSPLMVSDLARLGIVPNKSHTAMAPYIRPEIEAAFWLGLCDGDGCVHIDKHGKRCSIGIVGSYDTCSQFAQWLETYIGHRLNVRPHKSIFTVVVNAYADVLKVCELLYLDHEFAMPRKREKALRAIEICKAALKRKEVKMCGVPGCKREHRTKGYCAVHAYDAKVGKPFTDPSDMPERGVCGFEDCGREEYGRGLCMKCHRRVTDREKKLKAKYGPHVTTCPDVPIPFPAYLCI